MVPYISHYQVNERPELLHQIQQYWRVRKAKKTAAVHHVLCRILKEYHDKLLGSALPLVCIVQFNFVSYKAVHTSRVRS